MQHHRRRLFAALLALPLLAASLLTAAPQTGTAAQRDGRHDPVSPSELAAFGLADAGLGRDAVVGAGCPLGYAASFFNPPAIAQTFVVGRTGKLVGVSFIAAGKGRYVVEIRRRQADGQPTGELVARTKLRKRVDDPEYLVARFDAHPKLAKGDRYALVIDLPEDAAVIDRARNPCPGGVEWAAGDAAGPFSPFSPWDVVFTLGVARQV